ncbi:MAG: hypothetical protein KIT79_08535 [Deltaproteobacteria bacterium]|nr:hypothetical protein [Deltaproteobacteria bacterium]
MNTRHDISSLAGLSLSELARIFAQLPSGSAGDLSGTYTGKVLATPGLDSLPETLRSALLSIVNSPVSPWRGKRFGDGTGSNVWLGGSTEFASFRIAQAEALDGTGPVIQFDYDVDGNPAPVRKILGEARPLGEGRYLARMNYRFDSGPVLILYFTLEP